MRCDPDLDCEDCPDVPGAITTVQRTDQIDWAWHYARWRAGRMTMPLGLDCIAGCDCRIMFKGFGDRAVLIDGQRDRPIHFFDI